MPEMIEILVDVHEQDSDVFNKIGYRQIGACIMDNLETGDVVLRYRCYTVGIEIKRGQDFDNSLKSGRLHDQICRLTEKFDFPILIVEDWHPFWGENDTEDTIREKVRKHNMTIRTLNRRLATYETQHLEATVDLIEELCRDLKMHKLNVMRRPVLIEDDLTDQMKVICSLPNIKKVLGERILDKYKTPKNALDHTDDWAEIEGIGKVKLARIKTVLESEGYERN